MSDLQRQSFWMVWHVDGFAPKMRHAALEVAVAEAERLARLNKGQSDGIIEPKPMPIPSAHIHEAISLGVALNASAA